MKKIIAIILFLTPMAFADGLLMPTNENYPQDFLRNRVTQVEVVINGLVAETSVYQEFVNDWNDSTNAVYSFPLPPDARATEFLYWYKNKIYTAVLKVREQAVNPGTGEGGAAALVNKYIGRNGIKVFLKGIGPNEIQRVLLRYVSLCDFYQGKCTYRFPLETGEFVKQPVEQFQVNLTVNSNSKITNFNVPTHAPYRVLHFDENSLGLEVSKPKAYLDQDFEFYYQTQQNQLGIDFYSVANDSVDGHFALFLRPQNQVRPDSIFPRRIIFLISTNSLMNVYETEQSIDAIKQMLAALNETDEFNIMRFNVDVNQFWISPLPATPENIQNAIVFLDNITFRTGSNLDQALMTCFGQIQDDNFSNAILIFTTGFSVVDPRGIEQYNSRHTGIFPIGMGDDLSRARLEMTAALNYGFVTYIDDDKNFKDKMNRVFNQISQPILKEVGFEFGRADLYETFPEKVPTTYAGSYFHTVGRYHNPGKSAMSIAGTSASGNMTAYNFFLDFSNEKVPYKFAEDLWAKAKIDALEWETEIYGETEDLKAELIRISLQYVIRCRYTAYIADPENIYTHAELPPEGAISASLLKNNYPNPFNPTTTLRFFIDAPDAGKVKLLKIYNLLGQLVRVIDISRWAEGWHHVQFDGQDWLGNLLPSGTYIVQLQIGNQRVNSIRMSLVK
jgi:hypothetical protein